MRPNCGKELIIMSSHTTEQVEILVSEPSQLHDLLNEAEATLQQTAMCQRAGIVVTRHNHRRYTLALSDRVPFGETLEQIVS